MDYKEISGSNRIRTHNNLFLVTYLFFNHLAKLTHNTAQWFGQFG